MPERPESALSLEPLQAAWQPRLSAAQSSPEEKAALLLEVAAVLHAQMQDEDSSETRDWVRQVGQTLLGPRGQGHVMVAQMNPRPNDVAGNVRQVQAYLAEAEALGADLVLFPELALMGYPVLDTIMRDSVTAEGATTESVDPAESPVMQNVECVQALAVQTRPGGTWAMVGFVEPRLPAPGEVRFGKPFFNSVAILGEGRIQGIVRKVLLPNYKEFEDSRTFESSPASGVHSADTLMSATWGFQWDESGHRVAVPNGAPLTIHGHSYGVVVCEDGWSAPAYFKHPPYDRDPVGESAQARPQVLINLSASPTGEGKERLKHQMLSSAARRHGIPMVYVNQVGGVDELIFDGASRAYDAQGRLIARARMFREQLQIFNPLTGLGCVEPLPGRLGETLEPHRASDSLPRLEDETELGRVYEAAVLGIRDYFHKIGYTRRAVLGLSGGLDSAVCAVLLADALGPDNVLAVSMPTRITPDENRSDAQVLAENLGIHLIEIPLADLVDPLNAAVQSAQTDIAPLWTLPAGASTAKDNAQARVRATLLWQLGNEYQAFPIATSDLSELAMGYTTINGDMTGMLAPIADMLKTQVRTLARWLNDHRAEYGHGNHAIPTRVIEKPSGADLRIDPATGRLVTAEQDLMPYPVFDDIFRHWARRRMGREQLLNLTLQYETDAAPLSEADKAAYLDKAFRLMSRMVYKWKIAPPTLLVNGTGISARMYHHPIVSARTALPASEEHLGQPLQGALLPPMAAP